MLNRAAAEERLRNMFQLFQFRKIKIRVLITHLIVTLLYPIFRAVSSESNKMLVFIDSLTIIALVLIIGGVIYALFLHGDFDISGYLLRRGMSRGNKRFQRKSAEPEEPKMNYYTYLANLYEKREEAYNYPLLIGILYLIISYGVSWII